MRTLAVYTLFISVLLAPSAAARADLPGDACDQTPMLIGEVQPPDPVSPAGPQLVNGHVWYGGAIYRPDGSYVRDAPNNGYLRGEVIEFSNEMIDASQAEWGVVGRDDESFWVYSPDGIPLVDIPADGVVEAVYDNGYILAAEAVRFGSDPLSAFLIDRSQTVIELPVAVVEENNRFGAVAGETVFVIESDHTLGLFDTSGNRLGSRRGPAARDITGVFSAHGHAYATTGPFGDDPMYLMVFDGTGDLINTVEFEPGNLDVRETAGGLAYTFRSRSVEVVDGDLNEVEGDPRFGLLTPTGHLVAEVTGTTPGASSDLIFKAHGRYLMIEDFISESPQGDETPIPSQTSYIDMFLLDGTPIATSPEITHSAYNTGRPAGKLVAYTRPDGQSVEFRDLSGRLLGTGSFDLGIYTSVETTMTDHEYLWIETVTGFGDRSNHTEVHRAWVYDLGPCAGLPSPGTFIDDDRSVFEIDIEWLSDNGITNGCDPAKGATRFCPNEPVTRGQMAAFFRRALGDESTIGGPTSFTDTGESVFANDIAWLSASRITLGCAVDRFCPDDPVTRGQMAAFLVRAFDLPPAEAADFDDTSQSVFTDDISRLAQSGITRGCTATSFCPEDPVTRGQMAAFFRRAMTG